MLSSNATAARLAAGKAAAPVFAIMPPLNTSQAPTSPQQAPSKPRHRTFDTMKQQ